MTRARDWPVCAADTRVEDAARIMKDQKTNWVVVAPDTPGQHSIQGIVTEKDIVRRFVAEPTPQLQIQSIMTPKSQLLATSPTDSLWQIMVLFTERRFSVAPVMQGSRLVGMVSIQDAVKQLVQDHNSDIDSLNAYIEGSY